MGSPLRLELCELKDLPEDDETAKGIAVEGDMTPACRIMDSMKPPRGYRRIARSRSFRKTPKKRHGGPQSNVARKPESGCRQTVSCGLATRVTFQDATGNHPDEGLKRNSSDPCGPGGSNSTHWRSGSTVKKAPFNASRMSRRRRRSSRSVCQSTPGSGRNPQRLISALERDQHFSGTSPQANAGEQRFIPTRPPSPGATRRSVITRPGRRRPDTARTR